MQVYSSFKQNYQVMTETTKSTPAKDGNAHAKFGKKNGQQRIVASFRVLILMAPLSAIREELL